MGDAEALVDEAFGNFEDLLETQENAKKTSLKALIPSVDVSKKNLDPLDPINMATSVFKCKDTSPQQPGHSVSVSNHFPFYFGYQEVAEHQCHRSDWQWYWGHNNPQGTEHAEERRRHIEGPGFEYTPRASEVVRKVLQMTGLDPTTTVADLDLKTDVADSPIRFGCHACKTHHKQESWFSSSYRDGFAWRILVSLSLETWRRSHSIMFP